MLNQLYSFINNNKYEIAYRGWNSLTAASFAYQLYHDPIANTAEYLPDIILHSIEAFIPDALPVLLELNLLRAAQAGYSFLTGQTKFPLLVFHNMPLCKIGPITDLTLFSAPTTLSTIANGIDLLNHAVNINRHLDKFFLESDLPVSNENPKTFTPSRLAKTQPNASVTQDKRNHELKHRKRAFSI